MITEIPATCTCGTLSPEVTLCVDHHVYYRSGKRLESVSSVIRNTYPIKPDFSKADPEVLEHAKQRGILVDALVCQYLEGKDLFIPRGTPHEVIDEGKIGFQAVQKWWDSEKRGAVKTQVTLADDEIAGTADILEDDRHVWELKTVSKIEATYRLQIGAYLDLRGHYGSECGIIHCAFSKGGTVATVKPVELNAATCMGDWRVLREMWRLVNRLSRP